MISRRDCLLLLAELQQKGINTTAITQKALRSNNIDLEVIKFINEHRQFEANAFYEKLRKSYNNKKSMLYKNIVTCDEVDCSSTVLSTLGALSQQILLYLDKVEDTRMLLRHLRFEEITESLLNYARSFDLVPCIKVLQIIKADLKAFEYLNK